MVVYSPINAYVYLAAAAGSLAGMATGDNNVKSANQNNYVTMANASQAFAIAFDTVWNSAVTLNQYEFNAIQSCSEETWSARNINFSSNPSDYLQLCQAIIAAIQKGEGVLEAGGFIPPDIGGGGNAPGWTDNITVNTVLNSSQTRVAVDTTGRSVTITTPLNPVNGQIFYVKDVTGKAGINPILLVANAGATIEDPNNPGNYGANGEITSQGQCVGFEYRKNDGKWIAFSGV